MKKVLITGASGFVGGYLCRKLESLGFEIALFSSDITDKKAVENVFENDKFDIIFHLAAVRNGAEECLTVNGLGTFNILEQARKQGGVRMVYISTLEVYGRQKTFSVLSEEAPLRPDSFYGITKLFGEQYCQRYSKNFKVSCASLRFAPIYGKGQLPTSTTSIFIEKAKLSQDITIYGGGNGCLDLLFIEDAVSAIIAAGNSETNGIFNIGSGSKVNIKQLAEKIKEIWQSQSKIIFDKEKEENCYNIQLDIKKANKELGFYPKYSLEKGLKTII
jgi:UDP-glucose 4-epimerase